MANLINDELAVDSEEEELQQAFAEKRLLPGLNMELAPPKQYVNNKEGLKRKFDEIYLHMDWSERLDITVPKSKTLVSNEDPDKLVDNDFKREQSFFLQAQEAAILGIKRLHGLGIQTRRPDDYFAEMAKSDAHMKKVREEILSKNAELERREKVRKLREMKKLGKQMQVEALKKKQSDKKTFNTSIEKIKKGDKEGFEVLAVEKEEKSAKGGDKKDRVKRKSSEAHEKKDIKKSKKQNFKDTKYGFGGKKKNSKYNTKESSMDITEFNSKVHHNKNDRFSKKPQGKFGNRKNVNKKFVNKNKPKKNRK